MNWASLSNDGDTPRGRWGHSMTALGDGTAVLFGGSAGGYLNDVYTLTVSATSAEWVSLSSDGDTPIPRWYHTMTVLGDGTTVLYGGRSWSLYSTDFWEGYLYDVYTLTVSATSAAWASLSSDGDTPSARYCHSMTALADGTAVLFGGGGSDGGYFNDVYTLTVSGSSATWASPSSDGDTPSARYRHSMTALGDGTTVLFGGWDGGAYLNDVYTLTVSVTSATWASLSSGGDIPSARSDHTMTALGDGTAVLFGGWDGAYLSDVYTLTVSGTSATWASLGGDGDTPSIRGYYSMTALGDGTAVLFGGSYFGTHFNDVYTLTVSATSAQSPTQSPTASPTASPTPSPTASPTQSPTPSPTASPTASLTPIRTTSATPLPTPWPACVDGELDSSWISDDAVIDGEWTCDAYSALGDLCACEEIEQKCCCCRGGGRSLQASMDSTTCVDDALPGSWNSGGAFACDTYYRLYGSFFCFYGAIKESCCHCGGGTAVQASTTSAPCVDDTLNSEWSSGGGLTCAVLARLDNTAHCNKDEVAQTCCHCAASGDQAATSSLQVSLSMSSSEEGRDEVCREENLGTGGGVYRSFVWALHSAGVESREARHHLVVYKPAPGEQPRPKTADGLCVDVDRELLERGRRHRRFEQHHGVVRQHLPGVRELRWHQCWEWRLWRPFLTWKWWHRTKLSVLVSGTSRSVSFWGS